MGRKSSQGALYPRGACLSFCRLHVFVPAAAICTILVLGLWLPSYNAASIIAFSALYGLVSGLSMFVRDLVLSGSLERLVLDRRLRISGADIYRQYYSKRNIRRTIG